MPTRGHDGSNYWLRITDDYLGRRLVHTIASKDQAAQLLIDYVKRNERLTGNTPTHLDLKVHTMRSD